MTESDIFEKEEIVNKDTPEPEPEPEPEPKPKKEKKPRKKRKPMTDEQREAMLARLKAGREKSQKTRRSKKEKKEEIKKSNKKTITKINSYDHEGANKILLDKISHLENMINDYKPKTKTKIISGADILASRKPKSKSIPIPKQKPKPVGIDISTYKRSLW